MCNGIRSVDLWNNGGIKIYCWGWTQTSSLLAVANDEKEEDGSSNCQSCARFQFGMIFFKRLLWAAATNLFAAWIIIDANLWPDYQKIRQNITNTKYDFIIGEL